jgi:hypothetical protein
MVLRVRDALHQAVGDLAVEPVQDAVPMALAAIRSSRFYAWNETVRSRLLIPRVPAAGKPAVAAGRLAQAVYLPDLAERPVCW